MNRTAQIFFALCLIVPVPFLCMAEEQDDKEYIETYASLDGKEAGMDIPPGMELRKVGSMKMIVPAGTQIYKKSGQVVMEGPDEFAARNIYDMKGRLTALEARQVSMEKELYGLKQAIIKQQKSSEEKEEPNIL